MSEVQIKALGELLDNRQYEAARSLCEANGYIFVRERDSHFAYFRILHQSYGHPCIADAMKCLREQLTGELAE